MGFQIITLLIYLYSRSGLDYAELTQRRMTKTPEMRLVFVSLARDTALTSCLVNKT